MTTHDESAAGTTSYSASYNPADPYAGTAESPEGKVYNVSGGDWDTLISDLAE